MTKKEKKAWDLGFAAHDAGVGRDHFPRVLSNHEITAWLKGWDLACQTRGQVRK